jgi:hypothetical protein
VDRAIRNGDVTPTHAGRVHAATDDRVRLERSVPHDRLRGPAGVDLSTASPRRDKPALAQRWQTPTPRRTMSARALAPAPRLSFGMNPHARLTPKLLPPSACRSGHSYWIQQAPAAVALAHQHRRNARRRHGCSRADGAALVSCLVQA